MKSTKELYEDFSNLEIPSDVLGLIEWLGKDEGESKEILRHFVISNIHLDMHYDSGIYKPYLGDEMGLQGDKGERKAIINDLVNGKYEKFNRLVSFIRRMYQPDITNSEIVKKSSYHLIDVIDEESEIRESIKLEEKRGPLSKERKQFIIHKTKDEIQRKNDQNRRVNAVNKRIIRIGEIYSHLFKTIDEYNNSTNQIANKETELKNADEVQYQYSSIVSTLANTIRPFYNFFKKNKSEEKTQLPIPTKKKNIFSNILGLVRFYNYRDELKESLETDKNNLKSKDEVIDEFIKGLSEIESLCITSYYREFVKVLKNDIRLMGKEDFRFSYISNALKKISLGENGRLENEYYFCKDFFDSIENMSKDIGSNLEIGRQLYSPQFLNCKDFEDLCLNIRTLFNKYNIGEIDGKDDKGAGTIEYRKGIFDNKGDSFIAQANKLRNQEEVKKKMGELNSRYKELIGIDDREEYARGVTDLIQDFLLVHPYSDGNGRTSRALFTVLMAQKEIIAPSIIDSYHERHSACPYMKLSRNIADARLTGDERKIKDAYSKMQDYVLKRLEKYNPDFAERGQEATPKKDEHLLEEYE